MGQITRPPVRPSVRRRHSNKSKYLPAFQLSPLALQNPLQGDLAFPSRLALDLPRHLFCWGGVASVHRSGFAAGDSTSGRRRSKWDVRWWQRRALQRYAAQHKQLIAATCCFDPSTTTTTSRSELARAALTSQKGLQSRTLGRGGGIRNNTWSIKF